MTWTPQFGAWPDPDGGFRVRMLGHRLDQLSLVVRPGSDDEQDVPLERLDDGTFQGRAPTLRPGDRYGYRIPEHDRIWPDPASRSQPGGVHGLSEAVDPYRFAWNDHGWSGRPLAGLVVYELHIGTFTEAGTFRGAVERLADLAELGINAIEIMPVAAFPGRWNWGYDGVCPFAPSPNYGTPDDLRALVDRAHDLGLAVLLDVVYNHFGPDGNYLGLFTDRLESPTHTGPWGASLNFDGPGSDQIRAYFIDNAKHWIHEYHVDGLRLDATHAILDDSERHFLAQLTDEVRESVDDREIVLIAEDHRNLAMMVAPTDRGGWGLDGVWADDWHHQMRRLLAGDSEGYFADFEGTPESLAQTLKQGWSFSGQYSNHLQEHRGTDPSGLAYPRFVICLQNHDQVGNRALGDRLTDAIDLPTYRAAVTILLMAPETPLLFMGQEWAASTPFAYFTDHNPELGALVTEGRRREFAYFSEFADPEARRKIPDPQAESTFLASRLDWAERERPERAGVLRLHRALLAIRKRFGLSELDTRDRFSAFASTINSVDLTRTDVKRSYESVDMSDKDSSIVLTYWLGGGEFLVVVARFRGSGDVLFNIRTRSGDLYRFRDVTIETLLTTEAEEFVTDPMPTRIGCAKPDFYFFVNFARPSAVVLWIRPVKASS